MPGKATIWSQVHTHTRMVKMGKSGEQQLNSYTDGGYKLLQSQKHLAISAKAEHMHTQ